MGSNSVVILGNVPSGNSMAIGCGAKLDREWLNHASCGFLEQDADVVAGFKPFKPFNSNIFVGSSAGECLEPGCKPIVNPGSSLGTTIEDGCAMPFVSVLTDNILFKTFRRISDE